MSDPLSSRISSALATVRAWDEDPALLLEVRRSIPLEKLAPPRDVRGINTSTSTGTAGGCHVPEGMTILQQQLSLETDTTATTSPYFRADDVNYEGDDLLLKRLALYFKLEVMSWVNNPTCKECGDSNTTSCGMRGPTTEEETQGGAGRVELYSCPSCDRQTTTFPRYNSARKLFETRQGRCGEYANLFGLYCRSLGFETRYVSDFTDHVWCECWSDRRSTWLHADSCEGKIDEPSMYEHGWGKKLSYIIAVSNEGGGHVADVTGRYSRKLLSDDMQARRREITTSEEQSETIIAQINSSLSSNSSLSKARQDELDRRASEEKKFFHLAQQSGTWQGNVYKEGRISGSLAWRAARDELGEDGGESRNGDFEGLGAREPETGKFFHVESFHPRPSGRDSSNMLSITVTMAPPLSSASPPCRDAIVVSGVPCAVGRPKSISVVIVEQQSGCILQSRYFPNWVTTAEFLYTVPDGRIAAIHSDICDDIALEASVQNKLSRLGGFDFSVLSDKVGNGEECRLICIGQLNFLPAWAICRLSTCQLTVSVTIQLPPSNLTSKLSVERDTAPLCCSCRLPEEIMPLRTQLMASETQKRSGFLQFMEDNRESHKMDQYSGYATRDGAPVYLLSATAFPFQRCKSEGVLGKGWRTHHYLPDPLVPDKDEFCSIATRSLAPDFDIPTDVDFFRNLLGSTLLSKDSSGSIRSVDTEVALHNSRLVALYFSAHWCGPCRSFTPMLAEFFTHLKEEILPTHGLEIVFVSSDRDPNGFNQYYASMPWLSLPFDQRSLKQSLSTRYGVRGIPALVVLDAITGAVVVPADQSRSEITGACRGGDNSIAQLVTESWLKRIPPESQSIMESLELSCMDNGEPSDSWDEDNTFLVRAPTDIENECHDAGPSERIKSIFSRLVSEGMAPNAAAAKAIQLVADGQVQPKGVQRQLPSGRLNDAPWTATIYVPTTTPNGSADKPNDDEWSEQTREDITIYQKHSRNGGADDQGVVDQRDNAALLQVIKTAKKYLDNVHREPFTSRFRRFKLSNKVFDRIVRVPGGIHQIIALGFAVYSTDTDFMASIPLGANLKMMEDAMDKLLSQLGDSS
mmetsp:Transcript_18760/g.41735  ORF Transcript_18760/g.41735 Transcript_18760/m.41735 type:complete len:1089 (-) Transcript_18760:816-4082(-)